VAALAAVADFGLEFEVDDFLAFAVLDDFGHYDRTGHARASYGDIPIVGDKEDIAQLDAAAGLRIDGCDIDYGSLLHTVLFPASADYGVYHRPPYGTLEVYRI
jgi:hypothetical protein